MNAALASAVEGRPVTPEFVLSLLGDRERDALALGVDSASSAILSLRIMVQQRCFPGPTI